MSAWRILAPPSSLGFTEKYTVNKCAWALQFTKDKIELGDSEVGRRFRDACDVFSTEILKLVFLADKKRHYIHIHSIAWRNGDFIYPKHFSKDIYNLTSAHKPINMRNISKDVSFSNGQLHYVHCSISTNFSNSNKSNGAIFIFFSLPHQLQCK